MFCGILLSDSQLLTLCHSGNVSLILLSMASALGYQCQVSVETILRHSQWHLDLTMSISDCLPSHFAVEHSDLDRPVVSLDVDRGSQSIGIFPLILCDGEKSKWQAICTIPQNFFRRSPAFTVTFWDRFDMGWGEGFKLTQFDVTTRGTVSRQISSRSSQDNQF